MSDTPKFKTFRDLRAVPKLEEKNASYTSRAGITSETANNPQKNPGSSTDNNLTTDISPIKDFQKIPNSVTRQIMSQGVFRGKSKQVWDYLWSISRGAINPTRIVRKSRSEIKKGSGLGSFVTVDASLKHLEEIGLLKKVEFVGSHVGNEFEILTPEEVFLTPTTLPSNTSNASITSHTQKVDILVLPLSGNTSRGQVQQNKGIYGAPKTSFKDNRNDDDNARVSETFLSMAKRFDAAAKKITGKGVSKSEAQKWTDLADLLILELEISASRTEGISSIPAFITEILRRQFFTSHQQQSKDAKPSRIKIDLLGKSEFDSYKIKPLDKKGREDALLQLQEFVDDDFLQDFKKWYTPDDWAWLMAQLKKK